MILAVKLADKIFFTLQRRKGKPHARGGKGNTLHVNTAGSGRDAPGGNREIRACMGHDKTAYFPNA